MLPETYFCGLLEKLQESQKLEATKMSHHTVE